MRMNPLVLAAALVGAALPGRPCEAMSVIAPSFSKLVQNAEQIVRVEATAVTSRWDPVPQGRVIHTYVRFQVLRTLKGDPRDSITLRLLGGQVGGDGMMIPGMPSFEVGSTYILFIAQNGRAFCPLVGIMHGSYRVVKDEATGTERVVRANGEPLQSVDDVIRPIEPSSRSTASVESAIRKDDFENAIIQELGHSSQQ
jgi:hypothetical protein